MKKIILTIIIFNISIIHAQINLSYTDHLAIGVKNIDSTGEFYKNILELKELENPSANQRWFDFGDKFELHLVEGVHMEKKIKTNHIGLTVSSMTDMMELLKKKNINFESWNGKRNTFELRWDGVKQIYFQDPEGNWIEINQK
ncbi:MAG: glyoxalase [Flavobacteriaceae bacterium]|nr:glyoxalase [Flavobacteriaceae bacterium]|tara:strand:- start:1875 stop:2303 length:429 start_codon:yes stop_codon:yes gene_type:complete